MEEKNMAEKKFFIQWWVWLLLVVTLVLIIGMSLYVVSEQRKLIAELESQVGSPPAVEETEATPPATNEYAGWKTYENNELGISFKYPGNWQTVELEKNTSGWPVYKGSIWMNSTDANKQLVYFDPEKIFTFEIDSKDYVHPAIGYELNKETIDPNWSATDFANHMGIEPLFIKKLSNRSLLFSDFGAMECSPVSRLSILTPLSSDYPNFIININWEDQEDGTITEAGKDYQCDEAGDDAFARAYAEVAEKIKNGTLSDILNARIKTAQMIADSLTVK